MSSQQECLVADSRQIFADRFKNIVDRPAEGHADVTFSVGGQQFGGLRSVLGLHSEVMRGMLFGEFIEARSQDPIRIEQFDHAPEAFKAFLYFMHNGKVECAGDHLSDLVEIANYFGVTALSESCMDVVNGLSCSHKNAAMLVGFAAKHKMTDLLQESWTVIGRYTDEALADSKAVVKSFPRILLKHVFSSSSSNVSELCLVSLLKELPPPEQSEMAALVRLPLVSGKDMVSIVAPSNLFDMKQCMEAMAWQADGGKGNVQMSRQMTTKRSFGDTLDPYGYAINDGFYQKGKYPACTYGGKGKSGDNNFGGKGKSGDDWLTVLQNL